MKECIGWKGDGMGLDDLIWREQIWINRVLDCVKSVLLLVGSAC